LQRRKWVLESTLKGLDCEIEESDVSRELEYQPGLGLALLVTLKLLTKAIG